MIDVGLGPGILELIIDLLSAIMIIILFYLSTTLITFIIKKIFLNELNSKFKKLSKESEYGCAKFPFE